MNYPRNNLELLINRIDLAHDTLSVDRGSFGVRIRLTAPRPNIAARDTIRIVEAKKGKRSFVRKPYSERVLFKQTVEGRFGLSVEVSRSISNEALGSIIQKLAGSAVERASMESLNLWAPSFSTLARPVAKFLGDLVDIDEAPPVLAKGDLDMDSHPLDGEIAVPLRIVETNHLDTIRGAVKGSAARRRRRKGSYKKNELLGTLHLQAVTFE